MGIYQLPGTDGVTPEVQREPVDTPSEPWRFNNLSHPRSNTSLKVAQSSHATRSGLALGMKENLIYHFHLKA